MLGTRKKKLGRWLLTKVIKYFKINSIDLIEYYYTARNDERCKEVSNFEGFKKIQTFGTDSISEDIKIAAPDRIKFFKNN